MNWSEYHVLRRGTRKEYTYDVTPVPDELFDKPEPEGVIGHEHTTTAHTHDKATGRSMHYPKPRS